MSPGESRLRDYRALGLPPETAARLADQAAEACWPEGNAWRDDPRWEQEAEAHWYAAGQLRAEALLGAAASAVDSEPSRAA